MASVDMTEAAESSLPVLPHFSIHEDGAESVLIIHGAFSGAATWQPIHSHLTSYHLLLPSLPHHGRDSDADSSAIGPFTLDYTSALLAELIRTKAHGGQAHVVGHSLGGNMALHLASRHPDRIRSLLVLGTGGLPRSPLLPYGLFVDGLVSLALPNRLIEYLIDIPPEQQGLESFGSVRDMALCREIADILGKPMEELLPPEVRSALTERGVRVLAVAATKRGILPTDDSVPRAKEVAHLLGGAAMELPTMRHAWHIMDPALFGRMVAAWACGQPLPAEFVPI